MKLKEYKEGKYTVKVLVDGTKIWYIGPLAHREDGPACEYSNDDKEWYLDGKKHREDGPAVDCTGGLKKWYLHGKEIRHFKCRYKYENWVEIKELNYIGPYKRYNNCFIELPFEVNGNKIIVMEALAK